MNNCLDTKNSSSFFASAIGKFVMLPDDDYGGGGDDDDDD
jgi:hypothetical protein